MIWPSFFEGYQIWNWLNEEVWGGFYYRTCTQNFTDVKAVEVGVQFVRDISIQDFIIEGDSLVVYNALCGNTSPPSSVAAVVSGIKVLCGFMYCVEFSHTRRQGNRLAHLLAKHAIGIVDFHAWMKENPCFIE